MRRWRLTSRKLPPSSIVLPVTDTNTSSMPEAWWAAVLGTGYRGTVEQLSPHDRDHVHSANLNYVRSAGITSAETNVVYAIATK